MRTIYSFVLSVCLLVGGITPVMARVAEEDPVIISSPDTVINKTAYSFTEEDVTITVSYGSAYPADHDWNNIDETYFAVLVGGNMTISADRAIQGIAINGWVKKNFSASCDHGTIEYLSDDAEDTTGEPVLTISDIENPSVTISCDNQLRCFSVEVYFTENPEKPQGETEDTIRLTMTSAYALDYSEDTTYSSEGAYSYWLALSPDEGYPQIWLDMYAAEKGDLSGEYSLYDYNVGDYTYIQLGADEWEYEYAYDQEFTITKNGANYHIEGYIIADNDMQYEFVFDGPVILQSAKEQSLDPIRDDAARSTKILRNGQLLILRGDKTYTPTGQEVK